jgi:uncharacterized protein
VKALLLPLMLLAAGGCEDAPSPPPARRAVAQGPEAVLYKPGYLALTGRVVDQADLLTPAEEEMISRKSEALEKEVGPQYVVVTVSSLNDLPIERYSLELARHWGLGDKARNDGLMLLVAPGERRVRIEVGRGLERRVTDVFAAKVIEEQALPNLGQGRYFKGIDASTDALIARLRAQPGDGKTAREGGLAL